MKTAEEIIKKYELQSLGDGIKSPITALIKGAMKEYAREACKEQRELCSEHHFWTFDKGNPDGDSDYRIIQKAPEPELK